MNTRIKTVAEKYVYTFRFFSVRIFSIPYHTTLQENERSQDDHNVSVVAVDGLRRTRNIKKTSGSPLLPQLCPLVLFIVSLWLFFLVYKCWTLSNSVRVSVLFLSFCAHPCWDAGQATKEVFGQRKNLFSEFKRRLYDVSFALRLVSAKVNLKEFPKLTALWNIIILFLRSIRMVELHVFHLSL